MIGNSNANGTNLLLAVVRIYRRNAGPLGEAVALYKFHAAVGLKPFE